MEARERAHAAFRERRWADAHAAFRELGEQGALEADDQDALAESAHWLGRTDEVIPAYQEAYRRHLEQGARRRAALSAFMLAIYLRLQGDGAPADGWQARAQRLLAGEAEGPEHGYPLYLQIAGLMGRDLDAAADLARSMQALGRRFDDETLVALGVFFEGRALVKQARVPEGLALLDEAMLSALSDDLKPMWTGAIYCGLLDACHELVDVRRAREWTEATQRWCSPLPVASLYPGICRVHTASMLALRGAWDQAEAAALGVCADMVGIDVFAVADAHYEVGEIRRHRGDLAGAEQAYAQAHAIGRDPQPGLALLRLAQGRTAAAASSIASAIAGFGGSRLELAPLLDAQAQIALVAGDLDLAARAAAELAGTAEAFASPGLLACGRRALGAVELANHQPVAALGLLRLACSYWQELDAPYEGARTRVLLAEAYRQLDDTDAATRECAAARACFERLGASADLAALDGTATSTCGLSPRELEVLRLVSGGRTNREIATALVLSEKTVARHVANIFTKLDVTSRSAATAFAYAHDLVDAPVPRSPRR